MRIASEKSKVAIELLWANRLEHASEALVEDLWMHSDLWEAFGFFEAFGFMEAGVHHRCEHPPAGRRFDAPCLTLSKMLEQSAQETI